MNFCQYFIPKVCAHPLEEAAMWKKGQGLPLWCIFSCSDRALSLGIARPLGKILLTISKSERRRFASILLAKFEAF
jgi:hypothetical protein